MPENKDLIKTSCYISMLLRHKPQAAGLTLDEHELTTFLANVYRECKHNLKMHFFGHFHEDRELFGGVFRALLNDVVKIE